MEFIRAGRVGYAEAWDRQRTLHEQRVNGEIGDTCLLLEHDSVYTAGKRTEPWERPLDGTPVIDVDRGGKITWHGPGQLVGYPIVELPHPMDVVAYVRRLEDALIAVCAHFGVTATRVEGRSGVWVGNSKIAAIGIRVARGVTMHGFALNCDCDLSAFDRIVPCGITDATVTSLGVTVAEAMPIVERELVRVLEGRRMLRIEARNATTPIERKPPWIRVQVKTGPEYLDMKRRVRNAGLHTVCEEAGCPNIYECWEDREATFLIGGDACTRRCDFCQIDTGKPQALDRDEPRRVAESIRTMGLRYATVTGVARDDLADGGAWLYAETVRQIHELVPGCGVELLIPDFRCDPDLLDSVFETRPEVLAHNVETVPRIFKRIRPAFTYEGSLGVITRARDAGLITKSNLILGLGEERAEITQAMHDLYDAGTMLLTITQYLRPSARHHPVERFVPPEEFDELATEAKEIGFVGVMSGPLVRSSYRAGRLYREAAAASVAAERNIRIVSA